MYSRARKMPTHILLGKHTIHGTLSLRTSAFLLLKDLVNASSSHSLNLAGAKTSSLVQLELRLSSRLGHLNAICYPTAGTKVLPLITGSSQGIRNVRGFDAWLKQAFQLAFMPRDPPRGLTELDFRRTSAAARCYCTTSAILPAKS